MDPVTLIVAALAAGAAAGGQDATKEAVKDGYRALRKVLVRLGRRTEVEALEAAPPSAAEGLAESKPAKDLAGALRAEEPEVLQMLLPPAENLESSLSQSGRGWSVHAEFHDCFGIQQGDHTTMTNTFHPRSS